MSHVFTVLLDQDCPMAAFEDHYRTTAEGLGFAFDCEHGQQIHRFYDDHIPSRSERKQMRQLLDEPDFFRFLPVTPGAQEGVEQLLKRNDIDLWVVTKPLDSNPYCADEKRAWLAEHFPDLKNKLILAPDKSMIHGDILIDDAIHPEWLGRSSWMPVVYRMPYNGPGSKWESPFVFPQRWDWSDGVDSLDEILALTL